MTDHTHDAGRRSWVESAEGHPEFPLQNLPLGVFAPPGHAPRGGVAIGDMILDLAGAVEAGLLDGAAARAAAGPSLNGLFALGAPPRRELRAQVFALLAAEVPAAERDIAAALLHPAAACEMHLPCVVGDYSDFYAGIHHARNAGTLMRPDNPLFPNYKHLPVGYHGRASSVRVSPAPVRRPRGQFLPAGAEAPVFGPCGNLDYELEMGVWIGPGNAPGEPIPIAEAGGHIAGYCLLNDWSARDIQRWEATPLGPFLAKSFQTSVSPWVVTPEALRPFRAAQPARPAGDPAPLPHLWAEPDQLLGALGVELEVFLASPEMRRRGLAPHRLSRAHATDLYWTCAQMVTHQTSNGCNLNPGDLLGTGTISGPARGGEGCLLEMTRAGREPVRLPTGEMRAWLEDGDEVIFHAHAVREGFARIGFGVCRGVVQAAR